jgi:hypothetical protein
VYGLILAASHNADALHRTRHRKHCASADQTNNAANHGGQDSPLRGNALRTLVEMHQSANGLRQSLEQVHSSKADSKHRHQERQHQAHAHNNNHFVQRTQQAISPMMECPAY